MKISVITPVRNMERFIARTIESVISQEGDFEVEYFVMDACSTDRSATIAKEYARRIHDGTYPIKCTKVTMHVVEEDLSVYVATNEGYNRATGDFLAWLGGDDVYYPGALAAVVSTLTTFPEILWLKGGMHFADETGAVVKKKPCSIHRQDWLRAGVYGMESYFVPWESIFFSKKLWKLCGPFPEGYYGAGDYWLWTKMARHTPLWSLDVPTSVFMQRAGQISSARTKYRNEQFRARPNRPLSAIAPWIFFAMRSRVAPYGEYFFRRLYSWLFMNGTEEYIEIHEGMPRKAKARTYVCGVLK
jgi:glycosyltransferase involved in cell wall biosynthesis